jgi:hypothetical protein
MTPPATITDALAYVAFLKSDPVKPIFEKQGFVRLP